MNGNTFRCLLVDLYRDDFAEKRIPDWLKNKCIYFPYYLIDTKFNHHFLLCFCDGIEFLTDRSLFLCFQITPKGAFPPCSLKRKMCFRRYFLHIFETIGGICHNRSKCAIFHWLWTFCGWPKGNLNVHVRRRSRSHPTFQSIFGRNKPLLRAMERSPWSIWKLWKCHSTSHPSLQ